MSFRGKNVLPTTILREAEKFIIRDRVQAVWLDHRSVNLLPSTASVQISNDDLHISLRTAVKLLFQLRVECLLIAVGCFFVWAMHVKDVVP